MAPFFCTLVRVLKKALNANARRQYSKWVLLAPAQHVSEVEQIAPQAPFRHRATNPMSNDVRRLLGVPPNGQW